MKYLKKDKSLSWFRDWKRLISSITLFAFTFQVPMYAWGLTFENNYLNNSKIATDLDGNAAFQRVFDKYGYQYKGLEYLRSDDPAENINGIDSLRSALLRQAPDKLGESKLVPIMSGSLTTFIPVYPDYKPVGTPFVNGRYVREQVRSLLGRHLVDSGNAQFASESVQLQTLYNNAFEFLTSIADPSIKFGDPLGYYRLYVYHPEGGVPINMVWPERRTINGKEVLVPIVYLTPSTIADRRVVDHEVEFNGTADFESININDVVIKAGRESFLNAARDITCIECKIESSGDLAIVAGGTFGLFSGVINAEGNLSIGGHSIEAETLVYRYDTATGHGTRYGQIASVNATTGDISIRSASDIVLRGVHLDAGGSITLGADGSIYVGPQQVATGSSTDYGPTYYEKSSLEYLISKLSAEETIQLIASSDIVIDAAEVVSKKGHIEILAGLGITIEDELEQYQSYKKGSYGNRDTETSIYQTVAIRSLLDAGKHIRLHSALGDITLRAVDIKSVEGTSVNADGGGVNLLMTTETDHYSYTSKYDGLFVNKTESEGHTIETGVPNTIVGGFAVEAAKGLNVKYEGNADLTLDEQISQLSEFEGLEWMAQVRESTSDVDWQAIDLQYETWKESNTSLTPAFAAVVAVAAAIVTSGAGASVAGAITSTATTEAATATAAGAAIAAGTQAFLTQLVLVASNGALNGDLNESLENFASSDTLRTLAVAMVTAGALQQLDTRFFSHIDPEDIDSSVIYDAKNRLNLIQQSKYAVSRAATRAGVDAVINGESFGDFEDLFKQNLFQYGANTIGATMAQEIKVSLDSPDADALQRAVRYIAHAGAGCILGSAKAKINDSTDANSGCKMGGLGAATGEIVADVYKSSSEVAEDADKLEAFLEKHGMVSQSELTVAQRIELETLGIASTVTELREFADNGIDLAKLSGALAAFAAGGDAGSINIAAETGENAAENNAVFTIAATVSVVLFLLKAVDIAITAKELKDIYDIYQDDHAKGEAALKEWIGDKALEKAVLKLLPGVTSFKKFVELMARHKVKGIDSDAAKKIIGEIENSNNAVWKLSPTDRGIEIEASLSKTDYKDWYNIGQERNGFFELVDFQKGNTLVSLKTVDTMGATWLGRTQNHIDKLAASGATVNGQKATVVLDLRVQPGGIDAAAPLIQYGQNKGITVIVKEF